VLPQQPREAHDRVILDGDPGRHPVGKPEVLIEARAGVVSADGLVAIDLAVVLDELRVQGSTRIEVTG
jgi:hypothetical protein